MYSGFSLQGESENLPIVSKHGNCLILIKAAMEFQKPDLLKCTRRNKNVRNNKNETHIVIHIEKRRKMREIKLYTILSTLSTDEKPNPVEYGMSKTNSCFVKLSQQSCFGGSLKRNIIVRKKDNCLKCSENIAWDEDLWYNLNKDRERKLLQYPNYGPEGMMIL